MAKKEAFGKFKEFCDMYKSNSPLICGEKLIQLFLWQIFTECLLSAGPCAEGWDSGTCWRQTWEGVNYETMWNPQALWKHAGLPAELYFFKEEVSVLNLKNWRDLSLPCGTLVSQIPSSPPYWLSPSGPTTVSRLEMLRWTRSHPCLPLT